MTARARLVAAALGALVLACRMPPEPPQTRRLVYLDDGWSPDERNIYYYTPQGTEMHGLRYEWFRYLELAGSRDRLAHPVVARLCQGFGAQGHVGRDLRSGEREQQRDQLQRTRLLTCDSISSAALMTLELAS